MEENKCIITIPVNSIIDYVIINKNWDYKNIDIKMQIINYKFCSDHKQLMIILNIKNNNLNNKFKQNDNGFISPKYDKIIK